VGRLFGMINGVSICEKMKKGILGKGYGWGEIGG
jgi:hypothetical protein